jgi:putative ABC transport system permease protein
MPQNSSWRRYLRFWSHDVDGDVDAELRFHFHERIEELVAQGRSRGDAERIANEEFGDRARVSTELRSIGDRMAARRRGTEWRNVVGQDLRYAARSLRRTPGFSALVVFTLALGIGANAALFSFIDRLFFRPPSGVAEPHEITRLYRQLDAIGRDNVREKWVTHSFAYPSFRDIAESLPRGAAITVFAPRSAQVGRGESPERVWVNFVEGRYFSILGVRAPALGRYLTDEESRVDAPAGVAVISHAQWLSRFGGDAGVIGASIELGRKHYTIVGVAAKGFTGTDLNATAFWLPLGAAGTSGKTPWYQSRSVQGFRIIVRESPALSAEQTASLGTLGYRRGGASRGASDGAANILTGPVSEVRGPGKQSGEVKVTMRLVGVAVIVLLIACANVGNLLLARAMRRRREIAIRLAVGISRARLALLLLSESVVLSVAAGMVSLLVALWAGDALRSALMPDVMWGGRALDLRVGVFTFAIAMLTALLAGLPTALRAGGEGLAAALKTGSREGTYQRSRLRASLVVIQAALSVVLLVGAGAFVISLRTVAGISTGYDADRILYASMRFDDGRSHRAEEDALLVALRDRLTRLPGIESVTLSSMQPMKGFSMDILYRRDGTRMVFGPGNGTVLSSEFDFPTFTYVTPGFFQTTGIQLLRGRDLSTLDRKESPPVIVVNRHMASTLWQDRDPIGDCLRLGADTAPCRTVIGIVGDVHRDGLVEKKGSMQYYMPLAQAAEEWGASLALVRVDPRRTGIERAVLTEFRAVLPAGVYPSVTAMGTTFESELRPWTVGATLFAVFGALALLVAAVGTFSTISYAVTQRTQELGVRIALGARAGNVLSLVIGEGVRLVALGTVVGIVLALLLGRLIASLLYETSPHEPIVLIAVSLLLTGVAALACLVPAWRATRVDPIQALRSE